MAAEVGGDVVEGRGEVVSEARVEGGACVTDEIIVAARKSREVAESFDGRTRGEASVARCVERKMQNVDGDVARVGFAYNDGWRNCAGGVESVADEDDNAAFEFARW